MIPHHQQLEEHIEDWAGKPLANTMLMFARKEPVSVEHQMEIAVSIVAWNCIAPFLGLNETDIEDIDSHYKEVVGKNMAMLTKWKSHNGTNATYWELMLAFWYVQKVDHVHLVLQLLKDPPRNVAVQVPDPAYQVVAVDVGVQTAVPVLTCVPRLGLVDVAIQTVSSTAATDQEPGEKPLKKVSVGVQTVSPPVTKLISTVESTTVYKPSFPVASVLKNALERLAGHSGMHILVKTLRRTSFTLQVLPQLTVDEMKAMIQCTEGTVVERQLLTFKGKEMSGDRKLEEFEFSKSGSAVYLRLQTPSLKIHIKLSDAKTLPLVVSAWETILSVKERIQPSESILSYQCVQQLFFNGAELDNCYTVGSYGIQNNDTLCYATSSSPKLKFYVRTSTGRRFKIKATSTTSVESIKSLISVQEGFPIDMQSLSFNGEELDDQQILGDIGVQSRSTLHLICSVQTTLQLSVMSHTGKVIPFRVSPSSTVEEVKFSIYRKEGILPVQQRLKYAGKYLRDSFTLEEHSIPKEASLVLEIVKPSLDDIIVKVCSVNTSSAIACQTFTHTITIKELKESLEDITGISQLCMRLSCASKYLQDDSTLSECEILTVPSSHDELGSGIIRVCNLELETSIHMTVARGEADGIVLEVLPRDSILEIKHKIETIIDTAPELQVLTMNETELEDSYSLDFYLDSDENVDLKVCLEVRMVISVKLSNLKIIPFEVLPSFTIKQLKYLIMIGEGIPLELQRLFLTHGNEELNEDQTLRSCGIENNSVLMLFF